MRILVCENGSASYRDATNEETEQFENGQVQVPECNPTLDQQALTFLRSMSATHTSLTDTQALSMPDILPTWQELLERGEKVQAGVCLMKEGQCYRVMQEVTPIESQPPGADGMLAVYRPIDKEHAGTLEDPIPWVSGMDCYNGKYYAYEGKTYLCKQDMTPCVWAPGTAGVWQWEVAA